MEKNLEEIFWIERKFMKENGEEVNPKPIGESIQIKVETSKNVPGGAVYINYHKEFYNLLDNFFKVETKNYREANAFLKKEVESIHHGFPSPSEAVFSCNFYKV